jgi:hypothetical protein
MAITCPSARAPFAGDDLYQNGLEDIARSFAINRSSQARYIASPTCLSDVYGVYYTNTIEGAFSLFDRMIIDIYHNISRKHVQKYADECAFRYNIRKTSDSEKFISALQRAEKRLTYTELIAD